MRTSLLFEPADPRVVASFIGRHARSKGVGDDLEAPPLLLIAKTDDSRAVVALIGHFARANRHTEMLRQSSRAQCISRGAHGYVSPSWMRDRTPAPTCNTETAHILVDIALAQNEAETAQAIERLLDAVEGNLPGRWRSHELATVTAGCYRAEICFSHVFGACVNSERARRPLRRRHRRDAEKRKLPLAPAMESVTRRCPHLLVLPA